MSNISSPDQVRTDEQVQDAAGLLAADPIEYDDAGNSLSVLLDAMLTTDANGNLKIAADGITATEIAAGVVSQTHLGFDPTTNTEFTGHTGDTANPHNVTDDQTGAATALANHAGSATAHHSKPTGTQSAGESGGYQTLPESVTWSDGDTSTGPSKSDGGETWTTYSFPFASQYADGARIYIDHSGLSGAQDVEVNILYTDGSQAMSAFEPTPGTFNEYTFSGGEIDTVELRLYGDATYGTLTVYLREVQPHIPAMPTHSHTI